MQDPAIQNAQTRRGALAGQINALQQQLEAVRRELKVVDDFIANWHTFSVLDGDEPLIPVSAPVDNPEPAKRRPVNPPREKVAGAVAAILFDLGRPASRAELFAELPALDIYIKGTNPEMVFSTMMWRLKNQFVRLPGKGYWFTDIPVPGQSGDLIGGNDGG